MFKRFFPHLYIDSIFAIPFDELLESKIQNLIFDIDNTLAPFDVPYPDEKLIKFLADLKGKGFHICLLSNNNKKRVDLFNEKLSLHSVYKAGKPALKGINKAISLLHANEKNVAIIGDQIFTDVWCGNRKGIYTILVKPIANKDELLVKVKRGFEKFVINIYLKERLK